LISLPPFACINHFWIPPVLALAILQLSLQ
jgi:hypothetical protein